MGANLRRRTSAARNIGGVTYVSIGRAAKDLGWSPDALKNWITAPRKFVGGAILQVAVINGQRWFTRQSVINAKRAIKRHGRFRPRHAA